MSMEKYGAEIQKYQVLEKIEGTPATRVIGDNMTLEEATTMAKESIDYRVEPI